MRVYRLKESNLVGYKGKFSCTEQDLNEQVKQVCTVLPRLPTEVSYFIIGKDPIKFSGFKDVQVNINNQCRWLIWLQDNIFSYKHCLYKDRLNYFDDLSDRDGFADISQVLNATDEDFSDVKDLNIEDFL